jgi:hypothetical protein
MGLVEYAEASGTFLPLLLTALPQILTLPPISLSLLLPHLLLIPAGILYNVEHHKFDKNTELNLLMTALPKITQVLKKIQKFKKIEIFENIQEIQKNPISFSTLHAL